MLRLTMLFAAALLFVSLPHKTHAIPIPGRQCMLTFCPNNFAEFPPRYARIADTIEYELKTNAQRLKSGVYLKPPIRRTKATVVGVAARQAPSPVPPPPAPPVPPITPPTVITQCGTVAFMNATTYIGYADRTAFDSTGQFASNETFASSLEVCFDSAQGNNISANTTLASSNWTLAADFPFIGLIQGLYNPDNSSEIGVGLPNYLSLGGVAGPEIPAGTLPAITNNTITYATGVNLTAATNVWTFDINNNLITVQWTNPNGSLPTTYLFTADGTIYAGGDPDAFALYYNQTVEPLTLHFIPEVREP